LDQKNKAKERLLGGIRSFYRSTPMRHALNEVWYARPAGAGRTRKDSLPRHSLRLMRLVPIATPVVMVPVMMMVTTLPAEIQVNAGG
jgi:hypothetical protein